MAAAELAAADLAPWTPGTTDAPTMPELDRCSVGWQAELTRLPLMAGPGGGTAR